MHMDTISSIFDWQVLMLLTPSLLVIAIFSYLLWSDGHYYKKKEKTANK